MGLTGDVPVGQQSQRLRVVTTAAVMKAAPPLLLTKMSEPPAASRPTAMQQNTTSQNDPQASELQSEWPFSPVTPTTYLTAIVKGAGPAGLAAAISLVDAGFDATHVLVVEKRQSRIEGEGRKNMVAIRPEGLRTLDTFGCLTYARHNNWITDLKEGKTFNEWNINLDGGGVFEWPILRYEHGMEVKYPGFSFDTEEVEDSEWVQLKKVEVEVEDDDGGQKVDSTPTSYTKPSKINEQVPCCYIDLGHLEDALLYAAKRRNIQVRWNASLDILEPESTGGPTDNEKKYRAILVDGYESKHDVGRIDLGSPDLIICASGKGDATLESQLGFRRLIGLKLEDENLPRAGERKLNAGPEREIESQLFSVFGVKTPARDMGKLDHIVRKADTGEPEQPVTEIQMMHAGTTHCLIQLPRGMPTEELDGHITQRVNAKIGTTFTNVEDMKSQQVLLWGDPLSPVVVQTSTAPQYVFGSNVVLVGDAAMSCSPSSGLGADIGMTVDSHHIFNLASTMKRLRDEKSKGLLDENKGRQEALLDFNRSKAEASIIWSQGSRWFYITALEAKEILDKRSNAAGSTGDTKNRLLADW